MDIPAPEQIYETGTSEETSGLISIKPFGALTTTDEVRAVLGLSDAEVSDDMLLQEVFKTEVRSSLLSILGPIVSEWTDIRKDKVNEKAVDLVSATKRYTVYAYAEKLCDVLPMLVARTLSDSKATFQRFDTDVATIAESIRKRLAAAENDLRRTVDEAYQKEIQIAPIFGSGHPVYDPVTGESS